MGRATQRWSDRRYVRTESASISWDVYPTLNEADAIAAVLSEWAMGTGAGHPIEATLVAGQPSVERPGFNLHRVTYPFAPLRGGGNGPDKLELEMEVEWEDGWTSEPIDRDIHGNPIVNAAGDVPDTQLTEDFPSDYLTIYRWESTYDIQKNFYYRNTLNGEQFTLGGKYIVFPGQCRCLSIKPAGPYPISAEVIRIAYRFEFNGGLKLDGGDGLWDGFKKRFLNQGRQGWWKDTSDSDKPKKGRILTSKGEPVTSNERLNLYGIPYDQTLKVESTKGTGNTPISVPVALPPTVAYDEYTDGVKALYLKYLTKHTRDFTAIFS
jgi:hypothetical protein